MHCLPPPLMMSNTFLQHCARADLTRYTMLQQTPASETKPKAYVGWKSTE